MTVIQMHRLAALEAALSASRRTAEIARKPAHELTDAEAIEEIHRLCHARPPGMRAKLSLDDPEIEAAVAEARRLIAVSYGR